MTSRVHLLTAFKALSNYQCGQIDAGVSGLNSAGWGHALLVRVTWSLCSTTPSMSHTGAVAGRPDWRWQGLWPALYHPRYGARGQCCLPYLERLGGFYTGPVFSLCVVRAPPRQADL